MGCQGLFVLIYRNIKAKDSPNPPQWQENCFCILPAIDSELAECWIKPSPRQAAGRALAVAVDLAWPNIAGQLKKQPYFLGVTKVRIPDMPVHKRASHAQ
jgi:hypothetical protein